jgi:uncharacterized C2H2 Zn-finger protein
MKQPAVLPKKRQRKTKAIEKTKEKKSSEAECPFCTRVFPKTQSLGGHISKSHPGRSHEYAKKKKTRDSRVLDRLYLKEAKSNLEAQGVNIEKNRFRVTKLKKELMLLHTKIAI